MRSILVVLISVMLARGACGAPVKWLEYGPEVFARARAEHKLVILDLEAVWCHWCHVMDHETYGDPTVQDLLSRGYLAVRVDQDARPDLANRWEDYGWPATIIFNSEGQEIVRLSGFIPPQRMKSLLAACIDDPTPGPSVTGGGRATVAEAPGGLKGPLQARLDGRYDATLGGWSTVHKYLDWDAAEICLRRAAAGDAQAAVMARTTLDAQMQLIDPVWGGVYQYSDGGVWTNPHYEKIMSMQAENMRLFSLAYAQWGDPRHLAAARAIHRYMDAFLRTPEGGFYTSQDADLVAGEHAAEYFALPDAARRARGVPRIDRHRYARENGWAIQGLCALYAASGDDDTLRDARAAAAWAVAERSLAGGGFRHDARDAAGPYLGDTLAMGRGFLALYGVTGERRWLARAEDAAGFIERTFRASRGYATAVGSTVLQVDENVGVARFATLLGHFSGPTRWKGVADHALAALSDPALAARNDGAVLLALDEAGRDPVHVTVVGPRDDALARALFRAALRCPDGFRRIEWLDRRDGPLPNADVSFPETPSVAAYLCSEGRCSRPVTEATRFPWTRAEGKSLPPPK